MAGKGFDAEKVSQTLNSISVAQTFEPVQSLMDTNIDVCVESVIRNSIPSVKGFLHNEHELVIVEAIEEARQKVHIYIDMYYSHYLTT